MFNLLQLDFTFIKVKKEDIEKNDKDKIIVDQENLQFLRIKNRKVKKKYAFYEDFEEQDNHQNSEEENKQQDPENKEFDKDFKENKVN